MTKRKSDAHIQIPDLCGEWLTTRNKHTISPTRGKKPKCQKISLQVQPPTFLYKMLLSSPIPPEAQKATVQSKITTFFENPTNNWSTNAAVSHEVDVTSHNSDDSDVLIISQADCQKQCDIELHSRIASSTCSSQVYLESSFHKQNKSVGSGVTVEELHVSSISYNKSQTFTFNKTSNSVDNIVCSDKLENIDSNTNCQSTIDSSLKFSEDSCHSDNTYNGLTNVYDDERLHIESMSMLNTRSNMQHKPLDTCDLLHSSNKSVSDEDRNSTLIKALHDDSICVSTCTINTDICSQDKAPNTNYDINTMSETPTIGRLSPAFCDNVLNTDDVLDTKQACHEYFADKTTDSEILSRHRKHLYCSDRIENRDVVQEDTNIVFSEHNLSSASMGIANEKWCNFSEIKTTAILLDSDIDSVWDSIPFQRELILPAKSSNSTSIHDSGSAISEDFTLHSQHNSGLIKPESSHILDEDGMSMFHDSQEDDLTL